jgi:hypothetical protein
MKRTFIIATAALLIAGCATNPLSREALVATESAYGASLSAFNGYRRLCANRTIPPSCRTVVQGIQPKIRVAQSAIVQARAFYAQGNTVFIPAALASAQAAVADLRAATAGLGAK